MIGRWLRWPSGMRERLVLVLLGALVVAQLATLALFLDERRRAFRVNVAEEAAARSVALAEAIDALDDERRRAAIRAARSRFMRSWIAPEPAVSETEATRLAPLARSVFDEIGTPDRPLRIALSRPEADGPSAAPGERADREAEEELRRWRRGKDRHTRTSLLMAVPLADGTWLNSRVRVRRPPLQWAWPALTSFLLAAVAVGALAWRSVGVVLRPMEALVQAAERLGRGERPAPLALTGPAETQSLADAFNRMADRLTRLLDDRARTLAAIGHDLRSPVTAMRLRVEMVDDAETRERLAACLREIEDLVEAALALSRGTGAEEPWVGTDLRAVLTSLIDEMAEAGGTATLDAPEAVTVEIHPAAVRRALRNIVENAVRYGGLARIALRSEPGKARIVIEDDGPGIAREDRERVFEPFMRLEASRSRDTGGAGLGLAIAKAGIEASGGRIELGEAASGGLQVTVCFDQ